MNEKLSEAETRGGLDQRPLTAPCVLAELEEVRKKLTLEIAKREELEASLTREGQRHRQFIESLPTGLYRKAPGPEGEVLAANQAIAAIFGYESVEVLLGRVFVDLWMDPSEAADFCREVLTCDRAVGREVLLRRENGTSFWAAVTAMSVRDEGGRIQYVNGLIEDITERKSLENQLAQAQKLEAMGQLAAGIAHEINSPIQYIGDNSRFAREGFEGLISLLRQQGEVLRSGRLDAETIARLEARWGEMDLEYLIEEVPMAIEQTLEGVERVSQIVRAMKEFSHPDSAEKKPTDLNKAIDTTITLARNEWKYVAEVETAFDKALPAVPVLAGDFNQVILNIIVNAAQAIGETAGGEGAQKGRITISTRLDGAWAEVRISDSGGGIPEEVRPKIFDLFFTTKEVGKGTGQGLAISRAIVVEKHGGTIDFQTKSGGGTMFIVRLPLDDKKAA